MLSLICAGCYGYYVDIEAAKAHEADCNERPGWPHVYRIDGTPEHE